MMRRQNVAATTGVGESILSRISSALRRALLAPAMVMAMAAGLPAHAAEPLPPPQGDVLLTVTGQIGRSNTGTGEARFDRAMLEQLGMTEVVTSTPWHPKVMRFEGVLLRVLLSTVQARGRNLLASAHNDYTARLPVQDAERYDVILALRADGHDLTLRDMGPVFIIYPYDSDRTLKADGIYARSVWQLRRLEVR